MKWIATITLWSGEKREHRFNAYTLRDAQYESQMWKKRNGYLGKTKLKEDKK